MSDHVIVWDLETVPDIAGYAAANSLTGKSDEIIREALGNKFPKHIYHSIVCIGVSIGVRSGPQIGIQGGPPRFAFRAISVRPVGAGWGCGDWASAG